MTGDGAVFKPRIHESAFIAEGAHIYGDVEIAEGASVWFNTVIRAEGGRIRIGKNSNIQDNAVIHNQPLKDVEIADHVTVGHGAVLRCCRIGSHVMIGMNATIMTGAEIGEFSMVGSNALITYNMKFPSRSLITGLPARRMRGISPEEIREIELVAGDYTELAKRYAEGRIEGCERGQRAAHGP